MIAPILLAAALLVGDPAPPLPVQEWLQGKQSAIAPAGKVTVVEFWATWCGPCVANIAHLTALQKKYARDGLVVAGATSPDAWGNDRAAVLDMIRKKGAQFDYTVAWLPANGGTNDGIHRNPWFRAAGVEWLPCAYVVDRQGRVAFIGDPMGLDDVVPAVLAGRWDLRDARRRYESTLRARESIEKMTQALTAGDRHAAVQHARAAVAATDDVHALIVVTSALADLDKPDREVLDAALEAATRAVAETRSRAPGPLDALARVWFLRGDARKAAQIEERAVALSEGPMREAQEKNLAKYRAQK